MCETCNNNIKNGKYTREYIEHVMIREKLINTMIVCYTFWGCK